MVYGACGDEVSQQAQVLIQESGSRDRSLCVELDKGSDSPQQRERDQASSVAIDWTSVGGV